LNNKVKEAPKNEDLIFIGNPRLKPEAQFLVKLMNEKGRNFLVLYLKLSEKEIYLRAEKRKAQEDERIITRRRIVWHKKQVSKTVKYLQSLGKLKFINGNQTIKQVSNDIEKAIEGYSLNHPHPQPLSRQGRG
jgi:adenylate kinase family enzyme